MANNWKIGTRWGNCGESVLHIFLDYGCVFFGSCSDGRLGDWGNVAPGDYFVICDGATPVALGEALGTFVEYKDFQTKFSQGDEAEWINPEVRLCPADIIMLPTEERDWDKWENAIQTRFCRYNGPKDVAALFNDLAAQRRRKTIVAVNGAADNGKTCAIRAVCARMIADGAQVFRFNGAPWQLSLDNLSDVSVSGDIEALLLYKNIRVGVISQGDVGYDEHIRQKIVAFQGDGCELIICATRTRGATRHAVEDVANGYAIHWFAEHKGDYIDADKLWDCICAARFGKL